MKPLLRVRGKGGKKKLRSSTTVSSEKKKEEREKITSATITSLARTGEREKGKLIMSKKR